MNTKYKPLAIAAATAVLVMLTACSGANEKAKEIAEAATGAIGQTVEKTVDGQVERLKENGTTLELSASAQGDSASKLTLDNSVGNVEIQGTKGNEVTVKAKIWAHKSTFRKVDLQEVLDQAAVSITLTGLSGSYDVDNDVGRIVIVDAGITGESKVNTSTGSIELSIGRMESGGNLYVNADIGSIEATLADSVNCDLETNADIGGVDGAPKGKSKRGDGGPLLSLNASVGAITVK